MGSPSVITVRDGAPPLLVLGVLPSDRTRRDWRSGATCRRHARRTWAASAAAVGATVRFVHPRPLPAPPQKRRPRRRLAGEAERQAERQAHEVHIEQESANHGDVVTLPMPIGSTCTCAELTHAWFAHATATWPEARYYAKSEDDVYVQLPALAFELVRLPVRRVVADMLWWGLFAWTGNGDVGFPNVGCWGGQFEDDPLFTPKGVRGLLAKERACPAGAQPLSPAPTHEIDVRSTALAHALARCTYATLWLAGYTAGQRCANDCAAVQGLWLARCATDATATTDSDPGRSGRSISHDGHASLRNVTLAHATWSKVHSNSFDNGWRPFAPPSNLTVVLDMNLGDAKLRKLDAADAWERAASALRSTSSSAIPPLLYAYDPARSSGDASLATPLNPTVARYHYSTCRWGGCHPSRGEATLEWPRWRDSPPLPREEALH